MASFGLSSPASSTTAQQYPIGGDVDISMAYSAVSEGNLPLLQWTMNRLQTQTQTQTPASVSSSSNNLTYTTLSDEHGYTLLHAAASYNQVAIMEFLMAQITGPNERIAFLTARDNDGDTALHYAGTVAAAKCLLDPAATSLPQDTFLTLTRSPNKHGQTAVDVKQAELKELQQDEEIEDDDVELEILQELIGYLLESQEF